MKNTKLEIVEILGWAVMTAGLTQLFHGFWSSFFVSLFVAVGICSFLFSLFGYIYYQFEISIKLMTIKLLVYSFLVFQAFLVHHYFTVLRRSIWDAQDFWIMILVVCFVESLVISLITRVFKFIIK